MDVVDHLIEPPGAPVPPGARCTTIATADGIRLRVATFEAPRPRGTVILLQGRAEYVECYFETIRDLQARGLSVVAFDWRGQGGSQRLLRDPRKGHVATMAAYDFDLDAILRLVAANHPKPWYVLAHSTGGLVAVANGTRLARDVRRLVLTAPFLGLGSIGPSESAARLLARSLRAVGLGRDWVPAGGATPIHTTPFDRNFLTSDPARHARGAEMSWRHPELAIGSPTVGWLAAAFDAMDSVLAPEALAAWRLPTLVFACGDDRVVSNRAIETFASRTVATDLLVVPGARHELLQERDRYREQFWAAFDAFVPGSDAAAAAATPVVAPPAPAEPDEPAPDTVPAPHGGVEPESVAPTPEAAAIAEVGARVVLATGDSATAEPAAVVVPVDEIAPIEPVSQEAPSAPVTAETSEPPTSEVPEPEQTSQVVPEAPLASAAGEEGEHRLVQPGVAGGDDAAAVDGAAAGPGGDDAARPLDDGDQRDDVVGLQPGLDHHVDEAGGDHAVGVAVDPVARQPNA